MVLRELLCHDTAPLCKAGCWLSDPNSCFRNKSLACQFQKASGWLFRKSEQNDFNSFTRDPKDYLGGETFLAESIRECQRVQLYRIKQRISAPNTATATWRRFIDLAK